MLPLLSARNDEENAEDAEGRTRPRPRPRSLSLPPSTASDTGHWRTNDNILFYGSRLQPESFMSRMMARNWNIKPMKNAARALLRSCDILFFYISRCL